MSPAGETGTSSTPPRANAQAHAVGLPVISDNISLVGVNVKQVGPWIKRDVEQTKECNVDAMLQVLLQRSSCAPDAIQPELLQKCLEVALPVCNGQVSTALVKSSDIALAFHEYVLPGVENKYYSPFIKATNIALACLEGINVDGMRAAVPAVDMICQQHDMPMYQTHQTVKSTRRPDLVLLPFKSACAPFEINNKDAQKRKAHMDKNAMASPKNLPWKDILACIERRTKPEYLPVDHPKVEDPAPGPSQTPATQPASVAAHQTKSAKLQFHLPVLLLHSLPRPGPANAGPTTLWNPPPKKKNKTDETEADVTVQMGLYAAEMFAANLGVNHLLNLIVVDDVIWIWYYDRQGIIQSSGINFLQDLPRFMVLLYALQRFKLEDWGRNEAFLSSQIEGKQCHEFEIEDENLGTVDLQLHTSHPERVTHYGLQGRATNVVPVTSDTLSKKYTHIQKDEMVAKIFWGETSRTSEPEILKKVKEIAKVHASVKDHIPELLWHHTFTNPTSAIREALGVPEPTKGSRVLYILVFRKLKPITELHGTEFFEVWRQCILCHITLWKEGVYHRDVSPGNMMWYWKDGKRIGVLNDYDLSSLADDLGPRGNERTGTVPFMALDLLTEAGQRGELKHLYRYDLESFMQGVLLPTGSRPLDEWATSNAVACRGKKLAFLNSLEAYYPSDINEYMGHFLVICVRVLRENGARRSSRFEERILNRGAMEQPNDEEPEDVDGFLHIFTNTPSWVKLTELSNPSQ
ncbi:hypothetical protein EV702DRAFT_1046016 [Suillus placidus]|uniref:Fungal-type protein kinase domain-containing protein n=1 Tax=Suillus placidus TaxID=48579 RepID=A0A9P6ZUE9_9AGAM|nr:hypothetical protein EV702DRAFT_1046016 [Suillus placidus]